MTEAWRYLCPNDSHHVTVKNRRGKIYCKTCGEFYNYCIDAKTGKQVQEVYANS